MSGERRRALEAMAGAADDGIDSFDDEYAQASRPKRKPAKSSSGSKRTGTGGSGSGGRGGSSSGSSSGSGSKRKSQRGGGGGGKPAGAGTFGSRRAEADAAIEEVRAEIRAAAAARGDKDEL